MQDWGGMLAAVRVGGWVVYPLTLPNGFLLANPSSNSQASAAGQTVGSAVGTQGDAMMLKSEEF